MENLLIFNEEDIKEIPHENTLNLIDFYRRCKIFIEESDGSLSVEELFALIKSGELILLQIIEPFSDVGEDDFFSEFKKVLPFALNICTNPKSHLKTIERLSDIEKVKKVTPYSLKHLGSHSEHWKARTISGVIPARMMLQEYEDDYDIYENIFFRIVIEYMIRVVSEKQMELDLAEKQSNTIIEWEKYGEYFRDYKRAALLKSIMPVYRENETIEKIEKYKLYREELENIENKLSVIISSRFFNSLNRNLKISFPVQPTNILKMDGRYREIMLFWNNIRKSSSVKNILSNELYNNLEAYRAYVQTLLLYGLHNSGMKYSSYDVVSFKNNKFNSSVVFYDTRFKVKCYNDTLFGIDVIRINISDEKFVDEVISAQFPVNEIKDILGENIEVIEEENILRFLGDLKYLEDDNVKKYFKNISESLTGDNVRLIKKYNLLDKEWRTIIQNAIRKNKSNLKSNQYNIIIVPIYTLPKDNYHSYYKFTDRLYDIYQLMFDKADSVIFVVPIDVYNETISEIKENNILNRIINYGEANSSVDAANFGGYKCGIIPVSQTDVNSVQRLIKVVKIHLQRFRIEWKGRQEVCPVCCNRDFRKIGNNSWRCSNPECDIIWGEIKCRDCGKTYSYIRPYSDFTDDIRKLSIWNKKILKENMFGTRTICDFEFIEKNKIIKYVQKCPYCGGRYE